METDMHIIELTGPSIDSIVSRHAPEPAEPASGEILLKMRAGALNFLDMAVAAGGYPVSYPVVPIADGAGEIMAIGESVPDFAVGDRVAVHPKPHWIAGETNAADVAATRGATLPGAVREWAIVAATSVVKAPEHLSWEEIASIPIPATTAWRALQTAAIGPGTNVVVLGTGVVSLQAITLAKILGARVIVTSSSDEKLERVRMLGADDVINYARTPEWQDEVRSLTSGQGADLVIETVGGASVARSIAAVRQGGTVFTIGFMAGTNVTLDILPLIVGGVRLIGSNTGSVSELRAAMGAIADHSLRPIIAATFPISDIKAAYQAHADGARFGKIALRFEW
jgi:NADPH:quinone reductase-like Zn-dependent oxidoreductase